MGTRLIAPHCLHDRYHFAGMKTYENVDDLTHSASGCDANILMEDNLAYETTHGKTSVTRHSHIHTSQQQVTTRKIPVDSNKCYGITTALSGDSDQLYEIVHSQS